MRPAKALHHAILLYLLLAQPYAIAAKTDWPGWGGPNGNFSVDTGALQSDQPYALQIVWKKPLGSGYSGIAVRDQLIVTLFSDGSSDYVIGLDATDGATRWRHRIGPAYLGHYGSQSGPLSTPLITQDQVIALSPQGSLFALDATNGRQRWSIDLVAEHQSIAPAWGFTTSPRLYDDLLIVQTGGTKNNAISAFNPQSGDLVWTAVSDTVNYQSPGLFRLGNRDLLVFHGNHLLAGLAPQTGKVLWQFAHGGHSGASASSGHPVEVAPGRYFVKNRGDGGALFTVDTTNGIYTAAQTWRTRHIKNTYLYTVHHNGYIFGYNGRILTCIDATNGERVWRSRTPGDGLPIVVDGHLIILTKDGALSIAPASGTSYRESARLDRFADIAWSPTSFADGKLYARSMAEIACVAIRPKTAVAEPNVSVPGIVPGSRFAAFVAQVDQATDKQILIDQYLEAQSSFPIIEGDSLAHFIYRGAADEVALAGDMFGHRFDQAMHRVAGTDLFYYSAWFEPDARITYKYITDLQQATTDPLNPNTIGTLFFGQASEFNMPAWHPPAHLTPRRDGRTGRIDSLYFASPSLAGERIVEVYLPADYDQSAQRYPVAYYHGVRHHRTLGKMDIALDNIIGRGVRPIIVVFLPPLGGGAYAQYVGPGRHHYARLFTEEIVPLVDATYRTIATRENRANVGMNYAGFMAFYATFATPDLFANLAIQSLYWDQTAADQGQALMAPALAQKPLRIYLDWGKYDLRSPIEGNNLRQSTAAFAQLLQTRGYPFAGGMVHDGAGWASWKNRTDRVFEALFPSID